MYSLCGRGFPCIHERSWRVLFFELVRDLIVEDGHDLLLLGAPPGRVTEPGTLGRPLGASPRYPPGDLVKTSAFRSAVLSSGLLDPVCM